MACDAWADVKREQVMLESNLLAEESLLIIAPFLSFFDRYYDSKTYLWCIYVGNFVKCSSISLQTFYFFSL